MRPILIQFGPLPVFAYGALVAVGALAAIVLLMRRARDVEMTSDQIMDLGLFGVVWGVIGARLLHCAENYPYYLSDKWYEVLYIWEGGLVFYGALAGAIGYFLYFFWRNRFSLRQAINFLDLGASGLPLGIAMGRMGCWFNGCCYGTQCQLPWAVSFPGPSELFPRGSHLWMAQTNPPQAWTFPAQPTQLYSWAGNLAIFFILTYLYRRRRFSGQIAGLWLILYACARFLVEFLRLDNVPRFPAISSWMTISQYISIVGLIAGICILLVFSKLHRQSLQPSEAQDGAAS